MTFVSELGALLQNRKENREISLLTRTALGLTVILNKRPILTALFNAPTLEKGDEIYKQLANFPEFHLRSLSISPYVVESTVILVFSIVFSLIYLHYLEPKILIGVYFKQRLDNNHRRDVLRQDARNKRITAEANTVTSIEPSYQKIADSNKKAIAKLLVSILGNEMPGTRQSDETAVGVARAFNFLTANGPMMGPESVTPEGRAFLQRYAQDQDFSTLRTPA